MSTWSPSFITANDARMMGDSSLRYVRFEDLDQAEKAEAREMWETTPDPYAFIHEHYYYPVSDQGLEMAPRILAIPEDKIEDAAYMGSLGYEKAPKWVPEPEVPESPFEQVLRMAATFSKPSKRNLQAADAPDFRVQVLDPDTRDQEWVGPSSQLLKDNKGDDEVLEALSRLKKSGDEVLVGGGAAATFILVRI
jgi:hypothetical protein